MDMLNFDSTESIYNISVNCDFLMKCMQKRTSSLKLVVILAQRRYTKIALRLFKHSDLQYSSLNLDKKTEQFDIQNAILC